jgi:hypothetical protein
MIPGNGDDQGITSEPQTSAGEHGSEPHPAAVTFVTTEHFTLQGERSRAISELGARASIFLATVSSALIALGLMATATHVGTAFYAFALILLPTLSYVGLVTFERTLQTELEDHSSAYRIARLRRYYFRHAPELTDYLLSVPPEKRLAVQGLGTGPWQGLLTITGMVAVITSVLIGATAGVLIAVVSDHSLAAALAAGGALAAVTLCALWRRGQSQRKRLASLEQLSPYA